MPSLLDLVNIVPDFSYYYGGLGNIVTKNLPYGKDRPGGGDSGLPYITRKPGERWSPDNADDGFIRFGAVGSAARTAADIERITKFFADAPRGPIFLSKQVGLQLCNVAPEQRKGSVAQPAGTSILDNVTGLPSRINNDYGTTRIYNLGANTLAQIGVAAIGGHFYRHGLSPVMDDNDKYYAIVQDNNKYNNDTVNANAGNRLIYIEDQLFDTYKTSILNYKGGPGSVYGVGDTIINRSVDTIGNDSPNQTSDLNNSFVPLKISDLAQIGRDGIFVQNTGPNQTNAQSPSNTSLTNNTAISPDGQVSYDFKNMDYRQIKNALYKTNLPFTDYIKYNIETRIGRGNPGAPGLDRSKYWQPLPATQDTINMLSLFYASAPPQGNSSVIDLNSGNTVAQKDIRDIIKFRIESIDNDNPAYSVFMVFRAFIQGDIDDTFSAEWNSYKYTGRGEKFYVYDGYTRQINLSFIIVAQTRQEMKPLYQKLNYLMSNMAPDYNSANKMRGNIIKLTVGDYMYRQPGILTGLSIRIPQESNWEIAIAEPESGVNSNDPNFPNDTDMHEVPMLLQVSLSFTAIQDFLPRKGASVPWISVTDRKTPGSTTSPANNNWLADSRPVKNQDGSIRKNLLDDDINAARNAALNS